MKIVLFAPYGAMGQESGILYMLGSYLQYQGAAVTRLSCNGVFSLCSRDSIYSWKRGLRNCTDCGFEQRALAAWSGLVDVPLSPYLFPVEVERTRRWAQALESEDLLNAEFDGAPLQELWVGSFALRFGIDHPDLNNIQHEQYLRRLILAAARMKVLSKRGLRELSPDLCFIAGGSDFMTSTFLLQADQSDVPAVRFRWNSGSRYVDIRNSEEDEAYRCDILLDSVGDMRQEIESWPEELIDLLDEIIDYLNISLTPSKVELPLAQ